MNAASTVLRSTRRFAAVLIGLIALVVMSASPALASTTTVSMNFDEPKAYDFVSGCAAFLAHEGLCGVGDVVPYGHATETIVFHGACSGSCDLRTVTVAAGRIVMHETVTSFVGCTGVGAPGSCELTLADVVVPGTDLFANAHGSLTGTVTGTGAQSHVQLSGTITTG